MIRVMTLCHWLCFVHPFRLHRVLSLTVQHNITHSLPSSGLDILASEFHLHSEGNLKLNTDGCWYESVGKAGFGGIFRNERGEWELGYFGRMMASSSLETELWSIYRGLTIILEKGLYDVQIESDSQTAVTLFNEGANTTHPHSNIINDGKYLLERTRSNLIHIYRGANECADFLARTGAEQMEDLVVTNSPPLGIREYMTRDSLNLHQFLD